MFYGTIKAFCDYLQLIGSALYLCLAAASDMVLSGNLLPSPSCELLPTTIPPTVPMIIQDSVSGYSDCPESRRDKWLIHAALAT
jgi:hypothetical protein